VLWRGRGLILLVTLVCLAIGALIAIRQSPVFQSTALIRIVPEDQGFDLGGSSSSMRLLLGMENTSDLQTSIGILGSRRIAEAVVDSLGMQVVLRSPRTPRDRVLTVVHAPRSSTRSTLDLRRRSDGSFGVSVSGDRIPVPASVSPGDVLEAGGYRLRLAGDVRHDRIRIDLMPYQWTVQQLQDRLAVSQPSTGSQLVRLRYQSTDSVLVASVPNLAAERFIEYQTRTSGAELDDLLGFLRGQSATYRDDLRAAEGRLQQYREQARIIEPRTQAEEEARRLAELQAERESLITERESLAALLRQIETGARSAGEPSPYRRLIAFPSFLTNAMVQNILHSIIELENERSELLILRTARDRDVAGRTERIDELETELHEIARNYLDDRDRRIAALNQTLGRFEGRLAALPAREVELRRLMRETELLEEVSQMIELKLKEEELRSAARLTLVQVVDPAVIPDEREFPRPLLYLALAGIIGLFLGSGSAIARERMNPAIASADDVQAASGGLPVLAVVNRAAGGSQGGFLNRMGARPLGRKMGDLPSGERSALPVGVRKDGLLPGGETIDVSALRGLRTSVSMLTDGNESILTLVGVEADLESAEVAVRLAAAFARQGTRVLLIDGDAGRTNLHDRLDVPAGPGMLQALLAPATVHELVRNVSLGQGDAHLAFLPAGTLAEDGVDGGRTSIRHLLDELRGAYDVIIVATVEHPEEPDALLWSAISDHTLLIAAAGKTRRPALTDAMARLQDHGISVTGSVLVR
jgi:polysaccharide biosynthesis transport protein